MRLLIINPNTSASVTARIAASAQDAALPGEAFTTVTAPFGPALIVTEHDQEQAVEGVLAAVANQTEPVDGIIIASFGDTGIEAVRQRVAVPVIGIARAAYAAAEALGQRFAIVSFSPMVAPSLIASLDHYGIADRLAMLLTVEDAPYSDPGAIQDELRAPLLALCQRAADSGKVGSIVLGGGPLAGLARRLQPHVSRPLIDGTVAAISIMRAATAR